MIRSNPVQEGNNNVYQWRKPNASRKERGQGLVEFALVIPLLILLMVGIFEFGYFFFVYSSVNSAARDAVRYGAGTGTSTGGVPYFRDCDGIHDVAVNIGRYANIENAGTIEIYYDTGPGTASLGVCDGVYEPEMGYRIVVEVDVTYTPIIMDWVFPAGGIPIHAQSARTIIHRMQVGG